MSNRSVFFMTTQTSATTSIWRILNLLLGDKYAAFNPIHLPYLENRMEELKKYVPDPFGAMIYHNTSSVFNYGIEASNYKFILNVRDPRDIIVNRYFWEQQHGSPNMPESTLNARREAVAKKTIDEFVLTHNISNMFKPFFWIMKNAPKNQTVFLTYATLCLQFDIFVEILCKEFDVVLSAAQIEALAKERPEAIVDNPAWIGKIWFGADVNPGRFRHELKPETIAALNVRYGDVLKFLEEHDHPSVKHTYSS